MDNHSSIVGDMITATGFIGSARSVTNGFDSGVSVGGPSTIPKVGWCEIWPYQPYVPASPTFTFTAAPTHHMAFPLKAGSKTPCGSEIVGKSGTTGIAATPDVDGVTCLACLRALAKGAR